MRRTVFRSAIAAASAAAAAACVGIAAASHAASPAHLGRVIDGDTIELSDGRRVRLLQIDTPEPGTTECYSRAATRDLRRLLPAGSALALERDPGLDDRDAYGRLLRYIWHRNRNVNLQLVRNGSATVWLFRGERGKYAAQLLAAGRTARAARRGLWGACPAAVWDPSGPATTGRGSGATSAGGAVGIAGGGQGCDPSYPGVCIPPPPPDLDCADVPYRNFRVRPPDPHGFDGEGDGLGCES